MKTSMIGLIVAGAYLVLVGISIAYELYVRIYDTGNSEFAGMMSIALALPSSLFTIWLAETGLGIKVGSSNTAFVVILGLGALLNAGIVFLIVSAFVRFVRR